MISVRKYASSDFDIWNDFVKNAKNSLFMHNRNFMEYHSDRFTDNSLMFYDDEELLALLPCNIKDNELFSHGGLTYGGFITNLKMKQYKMQECFTALKTYMVENNIKSLTYKTIPYCYDTLASQEDLYSLYVNGAKVLKVEPSTLIDMTIPVKLPKGRKAQIARAKREGVKIELSNDFESFIELENKILSELHNTKAVHSPAELHLLQSRFPEQIELYAAIYEGKLIAGTVIFVYNNVIHTQYMAADDKAREIGALDYAVSEVIEKYKQTKRYLDFGISSENAGQYLNEGLIAQKESFGGRTMVYQTWKLDL